MILDVQPHDSRSIQEEIYTAIHMAAMLRCKVRFHFNTIPIIVDYRSDAEAVYLQYSKEFDVYWLEQKAAEKTSQETPETAEETNWTHLYFVSFSLRIKGESTNSLGRTVIELNHPISSDDHILAIEEMLLQRHCATYPDLPLSVDPILTGWQPMEKEKEDEN